MIRATLADLLRRQARLRPDQVAFVILGRDGRPVEQVGYGDLDRRARAVAVALRRTRTTGDRVLLMCPTGVDFVAGLFGCAYAGVAAVPVPYPDGPAGCRRTMTWLCGVAGHVDATVVLSTEEAAGLAASMEVLVMGDSEGDAGEADPAWLPQPCDAALLQFTSGSTSDPRGTVITHANALANLAALDGAIGGHSAGADGFRLVGWLPLFHNMGLSQILITVHAGGTAILMPQVAFLMRPAVWLETITRYRGSASAAPNFAYDLCVRRIGEQQRASLDLSSWRCAVNGAEPVRPGTLERFAAAFHGAGFRAEAFLPCYGLTEAAGYVAGARRPGDPRWFDADRRALDRSAKVTPAVPGRQSRRVVACGRPAPDLTVRIVDPRTGQPCPADRAGEIWVGGASVAGGHWRRPAGRFGARLDGSPGTFLRTGDLGFVRDGQLFVLGRLDDLIILDGRELRPEDVEVTVAAAHPAVRRCAAFGYDEHDRAVLAVAAELTSGFRGSAGDVTAAIRREVAENHDVSPSAVVLVKAGALPQTTSGKVRRHRTRVLFLDGALCAGNWTLP